MSTNKDEILTELTAFVGEDVIAQLAHAAQKHKVYIHLSVSPYESTPDDEDGSSDAGDSVQR
jgi:hypothetical protein